MRPPKETAIPQSHTSDDEALFWDVFYPPGTIGGNIRLMFGLMAIAGAIVTFLLMRVRGRLNEGESILLTSCIWIPVGLHLFISISISDREFRCMSREFNGMHFMRVYLLEDQVSGRISRALRENGIQLIETRSGAHTGKTSILFRDRIPVRILSLSEPPMTIKTVKESHGRTKCSTLVYVGPIDATDPGPSLEIQKMITTVLKAPCH